MPDKADIAQVALALGGLKERCFLTGGASIPFYLTDPLEEAPRATLDIDVAIETAGRLGFNRNDEEYLRQRGFVNDITPGAPICRWKLGALLVDIIPTEESVVGFTNPWYLAGAACTIPVEISSGCHWRLLSAPFALASKCVAFQGRGRADPGISVDLEDIVSLINGRPLPREIAVAPAVCRSYLADFFQNLLRDRAILDALPWHLPQDAASRQRLSLIVDRMREITLLSKCAR